MDLLVRGRPPGRLCALGENSARLAAQFFVAFYRRRLPHIYEIAQPAFLTWSLRGSLPPGRAFAEDSLTSGEAFLAMERLLDEARCGPHYLKQPAIAEMVVEAIHYNSITLRQYELHAFVVMPNHVHLLVTPTIGLPKLTRSLKGITAKRANQFLGLRVKHSGSKRATIGWSATGRNLTGFAVT